MACGFMQNQETIWEKKVFPYGFLIISRQSGGIPLLPIKYVHSSVDTSVFAIRTPGKHDEKIKVFIKSLIAKIFMEIAVFLS